jgi:hypothetical protein
MFDKHEAQMPLKIPKSLDFRSHFRPKTFKQKKYRLAMP